MLTRRVVLGLGAGAALSIGAGALLPAGRPVEARGEFVDAAGRQVQLPRRVSRVFAAGPPASVLLYAVAPDMMVGWASALSEAEKAFVAAPYRDLPEHGRLTGRGNTANLERVAALAPDLIIDSGQTDRTYASLADRVQDQTGVPYVLLDGTLAQSAETIRALGRLLGAEARAERLAVYADSVVAEIALRAAAPADRRVRLYYGRGPEGLETGRAGSITVELIEALAHNVAADAGAGGLTNISPEQLLLWNPDVIVAQDPRFRDALRSDGRWMGLKAVREGRVFLQPSLPFGWIDAPPGVNRLIGARWLRAILSGGVQDLRAEVAAFYALFFQVRLSDAQLDTLLQG